MNRNDISQAIFDALEAALTSPTETQDQESSSGGRDAVRLSLEDVRIARVVLEPARAGRKKPR